MFCFVIQEVGGPVSAVETTGKSEGAEEEGEEKEMSYNYDNLKSGPEAVNISEDVYLELQYPSISLGMNVYHASFQRTQWRMF